MTREITITPVLNGFVCHVGCQKVVFSDTTAMLRELGKYYSDPDATEKTYVRDAVNKMPPQPEPCPPMQCGATVEAGAPTARERALR